MLHLARPDKDDVSGFYRHLRHLAGGIEIRWLDRVSRLEHFEPLRTCDVQKDTSSDERAYEMYATPCRACCRYFARGMPVVHVSAVAHVCESVPMGRGLRTHHDNVLARADPVRIIRQWRVQMRHRPERIDTPGNEARLDSTPLGEFEAERERAPGPDTGSSLASNLVVEE